MSIKADFNAEEWATVVSGPVYAGLGVISAEKGGQLREIAAMGRVYEEARRSQGGSPLIDELVTTVASPDPKVLASAGDPITAAEQQLGAAVGIVEAKAGTELDAYKTFVMSVAQHVAEAHKEGGFLGIGGTQVSDAENAALDRISIALGSPPAS